MLARYLTLHAGNINAIVVFEKNILYFNIERDSATSWLLNFLALILRSADIQKVDNQL